MAQVIREMTVRQLREALLPYSTPYRLSMKRSQLQEALTKIRKNEQEHGSAEAPLMSIVCPERSQAKG